MKINTQNTYTQTQTYLLYTNANIDIIHKRKHTYYTQTLTYILYTNANLHIKHKRKLTYYIQTQTYIYTNANMQQRSISADSHKHTTLYSLTRNTQTLAA